MSIGSLKVKIFDANGTQLVAVPKSTLTVGSASHCDIVLNHPSVLPEHVRGWLDGGRIWIQDLGSQSGTFLNGTKLPGLKPMLVRDVDVLKIGECPSSLGLEANVVRAPVVKPRVQVEEPTMTDIRPLVAKDQEVDKRREEVVKLSREMAELKLQLQMGRLDKNAEDELHRQSSKMRDDLRKLSHEKENLVESMDELTKERASKRESMEKELKALRSNAEKELATLKSAAEKEMASLKVATEREIATMKSNAQREVNELRDEKTALINNDDSWKKTTVHQLNERVKELGAEKARAWVTRPMSKDMIFELQADLHAIFRRTILEEETTGVNMAPHKPQTEMKFTTGTKNRHLKSVPRLPEQPAKLDLKQDTLKQDTKTNKIDVKADPKESTDVLGLPDMPEEGFEATVIAPSARLRETSSSGVTGIAYLTKNSSKTSILPQISRITRSQIRSTTRSHSMIRIPNTIQRAAYGLMAGCALGFAMYYGQAQFLGDKTVGEVAQAQPAVKGTQQRGLAATGPAAKLRFEPKQTSGYKKTYTDNALYTKLYIEAELNSEFRNLWLAEIEKASRNSWKVEAKTLATVSEREFSLIQDLRRLRESILPQTEAEGIQRMRDREMQFVTDLHMLLQKANAEKYLKLKRDFFNRNQAYLVRK